MTVMNSLMIMMMKVDEYSATLVYPDEDNDTFGNSIFQLSFAMSPLDMLNKEVIA